MKNPKSADPPAPTDAIDVRREVSVEGWLDGKTLADCRVTAGSSVVDGKLYLDVLIEKP